MRIFVAHVFHAAIRAAARTAAAGFAFFQLVYHNENEDGDNRQKYNPFHLISP